MEKKEGMVVTEILENTPGPSLLDEITDLTLRRAAQHEEIEKLAADRVERLAASVAKSGIWRGMTAERAEVLMQIARARGISEIDAVQQFDVIETKQGIRIAMRSEAMLANMQRAGWQIRLEPGLRIGDDTRQAYIVAHPSKLPRPETYDLTMVELDDRGVSLRYDHQSSTWVKKETYLQHGAAMLRARLISAICTALDPGVKLGFYTPEEISDFAEEESGPSTSEQVAAANRPAAAPAAIPDPPKQRASRKPATQATPVAQETPETSIADHPFGAAAPTSTSTSTSTPEPSPTPTPTPAPAVVELAALQEAFLAATDARTFAAAVGLLNKSSREIKTAAQSEMVAARSRIFGA